jgi:hypothetical protein
MLNPPRILDGVLQRKAETFNSFAIPEKIIINQCCDGIEDSETKEIKIPNYAEILKHADTRPADFECTPDEKVEFYDACKIPDTRVRVPPGVKRNIQKSFGGYQKPQGERKFKEEEDQVEQ